MIRRFCAHNYVGKEIKVRRKKLKMTQKELAEKIGTRPDDIRMIEKEVIDIFYLNTELIEKIAKALNCHPMDFYPPIMETTLSPAEKADFIKKLRTSMKENRRKHGEEK